MIFFYVSLMQHGSTIASGTLITATFSSSCSTCGSDRRICASLSTQNSASSTSFPRSTQKFTRPSGTPRRRPPTHRTIPYTGSTALVSPTCTSWAVPRAFPCFAWCYGTLRWLALGRAAWKPILIRRSGNDWRTSACRILIRMILAFGKTGERQCACRMEGLSLDDEMYLLFVFLNYWR